MATYIILGTYTDQGVGKIKDSPKRLDAAKDLAKSLFIAITPAPSSDTFQCFQAVRQHAEP